MEIKIPDLGDIDEVEVIELCVNEGDTVAVDEGLIVIESDKASMEVPSPAAGVLKQIKVALGDLVGTGHVIAILDAEDEAGGSQADESSAEEEDQEQKEKEEEKGEEKGEKGEEAKGAEKKKAEGRKDKGEDDEGRKEKNPEDGNKGGQGQTGSEKVEVLVPDIGEADGVVVIEVAVSEGDEVVENDLLVVLESDKASMEIAAEQAGRVVKVAVSEGQEVAQGTHIVTLEVAGTATRHETETPAAKEKTTDADAEAPQESQQTADADAKDKQPAPPKSRSASSTVYAGPAVRRLARELGVDLTQVEGTGARGRIVKDDVKTFVKKKLTNVEQGSGGAGLPAVAQIDYAKFGPVETVDLTRIQQRGAQNLHASWVNLPHVTQHDEADVTDLEAFRKSLKAEAEQKGVKVTPLAFLIKASCHALAEFPRFNSSLHADHKQLVIKGYVNIGMAVDTPEGLVVPVIRDANKKSIWALSQEIIELSDKARNKKLSMDDLQGGTFSISSLGALGGTGFTPIVNAPEVAILGVSNLQTRPQWNGESFVPRKMLPLSLSYDHRVINGADGGRFMVYLTTVLSDIRRLAL